MRLLSKIQCWIEKKKQEQKSRRSLLKNIVFLSVRTACLYGLILFEKISNISSSWLKFYANRILKLMN